MQSYLLHRYLCYSTTSCFTCLFIQTIIIEKHACWYLVDKVINFHEGGNKTEREWVCKCWCTHIYNVWQQLTEICLKTNKNTKNVQQAFLNTFVVGFILREFSPGRSYSGNYLRQDLMSRRLSQAGFDAEGNGLSRIWCWGNCHQTGFQDEGIVSSQILRELSWAGFHMNGIVKRMSSSKNDMLVIVCSGCWSCL